MKTLLVIAMLMGSNCFAAELSKIKSIQFGVWGKRTITVATEFKTNSGKIYTKSSVLKARGTNVCLYGSTEKYNQIEYTAATRKEILGDLCSVPRSLVLTYGCDDDYRNWVEVDGDYIHMDAVPEMIGIRLDNSSDAIVLNCNE